MKLIVGTTLAALAIAAASPAFAKSESFAKIAAAVKINAFDKADENWRRIIANRFSVCGVYTNNGDRRIDVLIEEYQTLADAVSQNDEPAAMAAGRRLAATVAASPRFEDCWQEISRRVGVKSRLASMF
ncbi:MAG TPA: hypothetical protein VNH64_06915 [Parvularculaceae bacterium]|nr:hypothetical protein [Parvularculaceae bacterium]